MKADKSSMFSANITSIKAAEAAPFPVYIFLRENDRIVALRFPGDPLGIEQYERLLKMKHLEVWIPNEFRDIYEAYINPPQPKAEPQPNTEPQLKLEPKVSIDEAVPPLAEPAQPATQDEVKLVEPVQVPAEKIDEVQLVRDVLKDEGLTADEKAQILSGISQDMLRALNQISNRGEQARSDGLMRCKAIADEILKIAAETSNIYDEVIALRQSQEDIDHSIVVGTIGAMFGMAFGYADEYILADLIMGSIFHDLGMIRVMPEILSKPEITWSIEDRKEYEKHVLNSVAILQEGKTEVPPRVIRMIQEHHENYDGSGFPKRLRGSQIDDSSQVLHLANLFDRLCVGKQTGKELVPKEAFDYIYDICENPKAVQEVKPEMIQRIFQFMKKEKEAADYFERQAEEQVQRALLQGTN